MYRIHGRNPRRARRWLSATLALATTTATLVAGSITTATPAHAFTLEHSTFVYDIPSDKDPRPALQQMQVHNGAPGCDHVPGLLREAHFRARTEAVSGNTSNLHLELTTHYIPSVAVAAANWSAAHPQGPDATCAQLLQYETGGQFHALRSVLCAPGAATVGSRFCALATHTDVPEIDMHMEYCTGLFQLRDRNGVKIADSTSQVYAVWDNLGVRIDEVQGKHVDVKEIAMREGVIGNVGTGPTATTDYSHPGTIRPYGKVQTADDSQKWIRFYDEAATAMGYDPVGNPALAYAAVDIVDAKKQLTINDIFTNQPVKINVADYRYNLWADLCGRSPWVASAIGDSSRADYAVPYASKSPASGGIPAGAPSSEAVVGSCDTGITSDYLMSAIAVRSALQDLVRHENHGQVPDELKGFNGVGVALTLQAAYNKTGPLQIRDPFNNCAVRFNLGTGRQQHGVNLAKNFKQVL